MIRILTNDGLEFRAIKNLEKLGVEVIDKHINQDELGEALKNFDGIVIRSATKLTKKVFDIENGGLLKLVIRAGVGIDNIDIESAKNVGVQVRNTPAASSDSVAELALAHIFSLARFVGLSNVTMRNGEWNKKRYKGTEVCGKTLGIIGMGRIGKSLAKKAKALGMTVIYYTIEGKHDELNYEFKSLEEVLKISDFISLHVPYDKNIGPLITMKELSMMKKSAYLIDCARGKVVDEFDLLEALNNNIIAGAGLDVFEEEPTKNIELLNNSKVSVTPHIGGSTIEAQKRIGDEVVLIIKSFFNI